MLQGRSREQAELRRHLDEARQGASAALVLLGEAGIGKSALLDELAGAAGGCRVVRAVGIESEMELPFAALHQLCAPLMAHDDRLPAPQRDALRVTFGFQEGPPPDAFLLGLSVLTLLSEAAATRPLVCLIDDAQWLDRESVRTLAFVARRLLNDSVLMLFAIREPAGDEVLALRSLPALTVGGLPGADARKLLASVLRWPLDNDAREAILAEARGNPLALVELPLAPATLAGGFGLPRPLPGRIEDSFRRRAEALPADARLLMLLAAAHPAGDSIVLWRAAAGLGLGSEAARAAEEGGLLTIGVRAVFRHPLVRSAVYGAATPADRRRVHAALAEVTDPAADPDRRAWHRAHAAEDADETVAAELEASAGRAQARGGLAAAAAFLRRAAELSDDPGRRAERELTAARALYQAGSPTEASRLLALADAGPADERRGVRIGLLRGQMAFSDARRADAPAMLLDAGRRLERLDPGGAREVYLDAFAAAIFAGRFGGDTLAEIAAAARQAAPASDPRGTDLLLDALATLFTEGFATGIPLVRVALDRIRHDEQTLAEAMHWLYPVGHLAYTAWDQEAWRELIARYLGLVRAAGALARLSYLASHRIALHLYAGELDQAGALVEEIEAVDAATGYDRPAYPALAVATYRGDEAQALRLIDQVTADEAERREGAVLTLVQMCAAVLHNGRGDHAAAKVAAERATSGSARETGFVNWALPELVEAAARSGDLPAAERAPQRLVERTRPGGTDWALGVEACSRALVSDDAEDHFREAVVRLGRCGAAFALARAHLLYGEWLCHRGRPGDAVVQLRQAYEMYVGFGSEAFAERARRALAATGETVRARPMAAGADLTAQERQIARRARDGLSNTQIGAELFLSSRTVEWHLRKVFTKLGVSSRRDLAGVLPSAHA
ncbi:ATP-binding protein [Actinoplanes sp. CA-142083]|uniref:ATP-binding protein n=1 Tax=Actinoplanes sp. CA-142083 TaxID=3239903 RepID=UPI003D94AE17